jgi:hypothetical protein
VSLQLAEPRNTAPTGCAAARCWPFSRLPPPMTERHSPPRWNSRGMIRSSYGTPAALSRLFGLPPTRGLQGAARHPLSNPRAPPLPHPICRRTPSALDVPAGVNWRQFFRLSSGAVPGETNPSFSRHSIHLSPFFCRQLAKIGITSAVPSSPALNPEDRWRSSRQISGVGGARAF